MSNSDFQETGTDKALVVMECAFGNGTILLIVFSFFAASHETVATKELLHMSLGPSATAQ